MATLLEIYNLRYQTVTLKQRMIAAIAQASYDVLNEDAGTPNHANRVIWAYTTLADAQAMAERMMWGLISNATVAAAGDGSTDADIQFVVNSLIDSYANALAG